jgi:serine/threonine protein kinase
MTMKVGTQRWMAPEVIQGEDNDEKAEVFSFGVVLSEIDTNKIPDTTHEISGMTPLAMMQSVARGQLTVEFSWSYYKTESRGQPYRCLACSESVVPRP